MNNVYEKLAKQAGFVFWEDEQWNANNSMIDWSCNYDNEFDKYSKLLIQETIDQLKLTQQFKSCE